MAENEVGRVAFGVELTTDPLASQAADLQRKVEDIAEKAGEKAGKAFADEAAKAFEKNADKIADAGERAGEDAGRGAEKGLKRGSKGISAESGDAGDKAGKSFLSRFSKQAGGDGGIMGAFKGIAGKIAKAAAAAFAAKKIFDFGKYAVTMGSDLNEVQNVVDSTFGQGSDAQKSVNDFAKNAASQFGLSETMAKRYAGTFGAMGRSFGFSADQAAEMSTKLAGLSGDVASFYNISQDEAYTKLKSVFTGETESLKDLGVVMTQANLDQFALSHGLGTTTARMSEQQKVALRYQFVLEKLNTASNDFARTSGSWANQVRLLKLQFESLAATIGQVLIAALTPAIRALNAFMGVLVKAANTFKSFVFSLFGLEASAMGTGAAGALPGALGDIGDSAGGAADGLGNVGDAAKGAGKDASKAANEIKRSLASFDKITKLTDQSDSGGGSGGSGGGGNGGGSGSGGSGGGAGSLGDTSSALTNTAWSVGESGGPLDAIINKLKALKDMFMGGFWEGLGDLSVFDSIQKNIEGIGQHLKNIFTDPEVVKAASDYADKVAYNLGRMAGATVSVGATIVDNITGGIEKYLEQHEDDIKKALIRCFNISGDIYDITGDFATAFADVFSVFRSDEAKQTTANIISMFATAFDTVLETALKFGRDTLEAITKPFTDNKIEIKLSLDSAITQLQNYTKGLDAVFTQMGKTIGEVYDGSIGPLIRSIGEGVSGLVNTFLTSWNGTVAPVLEQISKKFADVCETHVAPMIESLGQTLSSVFTLIKTLWENILQPILDVAVKTLVPVLGDIAAGMGGILLDAITLVSDGLKTLSDIIRPVIDFITQLIDKVTSLDFSKVTKGIDDVSGKVTGLPKVVTTTISVGLEKAKAWASDAWDIIQGGAKNIKNTVTTELKKGAEWASEAWEVIKNGGQTIKTTVEQALKAVKGDGWDKRAEWATQIEQKLKAVKGDLWDKRAEWATQISQKLKAIKGDAWGDRAGWATQINQKLKAVKGDAWGSISSWASQINQRLKAVKGDSWGSRAGWATQINQRLKAVKGDGWNSIKHWASQISIKAKVNRLSPHISWTSIGSGKFSVRIPSGISFRKLGGIFWNNIWKSLPQYAAGGLPGHGSMFVAGEAGPEMVGHVGGRTEVLNKSQLASTMHAAVTSGMTAVSNRLASVIAGTMATYTGAVGRDMGVYLPHLADVGNGIRTDTAQLVAYAKQAEMAANGGNNAEVLELLRKILEVLLLIDPDVYIDGEKVTAKIISIINAQTRATGRPAIIV